MKAWHPNPSGFRPSELVSPVYDTLGFEEHQKLDRLPYNAATFTSRRSDLSGPDFLRAAAESLERALAARAYVQDPSEGFYVYAIEYRPEEDILEAIAPGERRPGYMLLGLVGSLSMDRPEEIALHERTFSDRVEERVSLTQVTGKHFAPVMAGYTLESHAINDRIEEILGVDRRNLSFRPKVPPLVEAQVNGSTHRLWQISDPSTVRELRGLLADRRLVILDGHHRFTAFTRLRERGRKVRPLTMLVEAHDRALLLLPWHRVVPPTQAPSGRILEGLRARFPSVTRGGENLTIPGIMETLRELRARQKTGFVVWEHGSSHLVEGSPLNSEGDDYRMLHEFLEGDLHLDPGAFSFVRSPGRALSEAKGNDGTAFLLPPLSMEGVEKEAFSGHFMAQKSTMFLPKVAEGLIFAPADEPQSQASPDHTRT